MANQWPGMEVLSREEVGTLHKSGKFRGCCKLYPDGTKEEINYITRQEIKKHYDNGGEFGKEKFEIVKVELQIALSQEDIDDIMCGALEGGITYWCYKTEVVGVYLGEYVSEQIARGGILKLHDCEAGKVYELDKAKFLKGIELWVKDPVGCNCLEHIDNKLRIDTCNADAVVCDAIIQYAIFGDVIYS